MGWKPMPLLNSPQPHLHILLLIVRHVGRGPTSILGRTALHFYETFCEGKVAFNYGFNVANIQRFSLKFLF